MKQNHAIILVLSLVIAFIIAFAYLLCTCGARAARAEVHELGLKRSEAVKGGVGGGVGGGEGAEEG
ncbi:hypothetical protein J1614_008343 [Plenodomus biglobosus]|nr:hypothetical protein J1614_008343 [Plenodomus biglobosus]